MSDVRVSPAPIGKPAQLQSLQILRGLASTSVVYYHIQVLPVFGSFGVDIFFIISGFVMAMMVASGQTPRSFAIHRLARIVPLYWILTASVLVLAAVKPTLLNSTTANLGNFLKSLLFIPYFKEDGSLKPMIPVGWTLNYEMMFYACIWLSMLLARRYYILLTTLGIALPYVLWGNPNGHKLASVFFGMSASFEFVLGMLAYRLFEYRSHWQPARGLLIFVAATSCISMAITEACHIRADRLLLNGMPAMLLVLSVLYLESDIARLSPRLLSLLTAIGDASYATYLSHLYVVEGIRKIAYQQFKLINPYALPGVILILASALLCGHLLYRHVDLPLSRYVKARFSAVGGRA